jgi:hypothetical protein
MDDVHLLTLANQSLPDKRVFESDPTYIGESSPPEPKKRRKALDRDESLEAHPTYGYVIGSQSQKKASKMQVQKQTPAQIAETVRAANQLGTQHMQTQQQSRAQTQRARAATGRVAGAARSKWTTEETGGLYAYIVKEGTSWAHIKTVDDAGAQLLTLRSQVDLKDKARNMKFDILKAGLELPRNFENVPLAKAMREKLESMGRTAVPPAAAAVNDLMSGGLPTLPYGQSQEDDDENAFENM